MNDLKTFTSLTFAQKQFWSTIRLIAVAKQPYISGAILRLLPVGVVGTETMSVDKFWRCYVDFDYMMNKGYEFSASVLGHEPWHLLRNHHIHPEGNNVSDALGLLWNAAGDLEINDDIKHIVPDTAIQAGEGLFKQFMPNKTINTYYSQLAILYKKKEKEKTESVAGGSEGADNNNSTSSDSETVDNVDNGSSLLGELLSDQKSCGSGAGSMELIDYELDENEYKIVSGFESNLIRNSVAANISKMSANDWDLVDSGLQASLQLWADEVINYKPVNWRNVFNSNLRLSKSFKFGQQDYVKTIPNRRQPIAGVLLPALKAPAIKVAVGVDTSGSNVDKLGFAVKEIMELINKAGVRGRDLIFFCVDESIDSEPVFIKNVSDLNFSGAGGTDLNVAYDFVSSKLNNKIDVFILLTDGEYDDWYTTKPVKTQNIMFINCIIVDTINEPELSKEVVANAKKKLSNWSKVVVIDISENVSC